MQVKLTMTGRRSGEPRTVTLYAWPDGDAYVVVGSKGGAKDDPAWAVNLRADPAAALRTGKTEQRVRAREVTGEERERLWELVTGHFPLYGTYQRRTSRVIPVFLLEPAEPA